MLSVPRGVFNANGCCFFRGFKVTMTAREHHDLMANALRALSMDAVEAAKSGHPGLPLGAADVATTLFANILKFDPTAPEWPDRDRFILSAGHGSMLLYSLLHVLGYDGVTLDEIRNFRQMGSRTPGHPEYGHTVGVETTTGPLGQGIANGVGMALAEEILSARFGKDIVDHRTWVLASDGDLMEGISQEALAFAGHIRLKKLTILFDDNGISIDGPLSLSDSTDQCARFAASGWNTIAVDGHDPVALLDAMKQAEQSETPTLIACKTTIGYGAPTKAGLSISHGSPLGKDEIEGTRRNLGWTSGSFDVPQNVRDLWTQAACRSVGIRAAWVKRFKALSPEIQADFERAMKGELPASFKKTIAKFKDELISKPLEVATRKSSELVIERIADVLGDLVSGSADLTGSNNTKVKALAKIEPGNFAGRFVHWGIREHSMAAAMNGMALHGGVIPVSGTFLVFSDYCRPALRLAALMGIRAVHVFTHDSIGVGEDGPTHQPVEHLAALRAIPNLQVLRPCDTVETAECWEIAVVSSKRPSVLALTRQNLPQLRLKDEVQNLSARGAYEINPAKGEARVSLFASGSEVSLAVDAKKTLESQGVAARVVSVPCLDLFLEQDEAYRASVIGTAPVRIAVEAGIRLGWDAVIGSKGIFIGMDSFGASGPYLEVYKHFGITAEAVVKAAVERLG
jgi:transketolase